MIYACNAYTRIAMVHGQQAVYEMALALSVCVHIRQRP